MKYDYQREQRSFAFSERQTRSRTPSCFGTRRPQITLLFRANLPTPLMKTKKAVAGALDCSSLGKDPDSQVTAHTFFVFQSGFPSTEKGLNKAHTLEQRQLNFSHGPNLPPTVKNHHHHKTED